MKNSRLVLSLLLALAAPAVLAQTAAAPAAAKTAYVAPPWTYKTKQLSKAEIDGYLANPGSVVFIDLRRPDELPKNGSFPVFLSIQLKDLEKSLDYIPKDRVIVTVSNRAHRAGAAGDILTPKGFKVAGAAGSLDYEDAGGTVAHIVPPPPRPAQ